jgi:hypothetical protein
LWRWSCLAPKEGTNAAGKQDQDMAALVDRPGVMFVVSLVGFFLAACIGLLLAQAVVGRRASTVHTLLTRPL